MVIGRITIRRMYIQIPDAQLRGTSELYDKFYAAGGFDYPEHRLKNAQEMIERVISIAGWNSGDRILDVGCGMGYHACMLHEAGLDVTGIDVSPVGIEKAKEINPGPHYVASSIERWETDAQYDGIFAYAPSFYHYELNVEHNKHSMPVSLITEKLFSILKANHAFVVRCTSDFSGIQNPKTGTYQQKLSEYKHHFSRFGEIIHLQDYYGVPLMHLSDAEAVGRENVEMIIRKHNEPRY